MGWWEDLNQAISDTGILQAIDPVARDVIPGYAAYEDLVGIDVKKWGPGTFNNPAAGGTGAPSAPPGPDVIFLNNKPFSPGGAAPMDWSDMGLNPYAMTTTRPRGLIPYQGGMIPSGYRVANRAPRRPTQGYPGGVYLVPRRHMNPLNPRALMRAERRMHAFTTWVTRHFKIAAAFPKRRGRKGGRFAKRRR